MKFPTETPTTKGPNMKTRRHGQQACLLLACVLMLPSMANAQIVTNWAAYNDHRGGPAIPPHSPTIRTNRPGGGTGGEWGTHVRATRYDMGAPNNLPPSPLTNFFTGAQLPVTMEVVASAGDPDDFGAVNNAYGPATNSPAFKLFFGVVDLSNDGIVGVDAGVPGGADTTVDTLTFTFAGLDPSKYYIFRGTSARGGGYGDRWAMATITNVNGWIDAHINGLPGTPGVLTSNQFPAALGPGQAAWNSGDNAEGDVIGWDFISPLPDGTFQILVEQYTNSIPGGVFARAAQYGYSFGAILLAQVEVAAPTIVTHPAAQTTVEQFRPFSLSVTAEGTPLLYQWYRKGTPDTEIPGATFRTYSVAQAALSDSGNYYVVVHNPLGRATSSLAQVTVTADVTPPAIRTAFSFPNVPSLSQVATLDRVIVDFAEAIQPASAGNTTQYTISGGVGNPTAVQVTSDRTVSLTLASPLSEDTVYTVQATGVLDLAGNNTSNGGANNPATFRSWVSGPANGLIFEAFNTGAGNTIDVLTTSPNYPDNPFLVTNLWAFDTRIIFPDNAQEGYGGRVSGAFIPPTSGNWVFFFRVYERGQVNFNPNGLGTAGLETILAESTGNEPRNWVRFRSRSIPLLAGEPYYFEGLYQGGTGTDAIKVAARLEGQPDPTPIDVPITDVDSNAIAGAEIGFPLAPRDLGGALTIVQDVADVTSEANHFATFSVGVSNPSGLRVLYQWTRNGEVIPGATGPNYTFLATENSDGDKYRVRAMKIGSQPIQSREATLHVTPDNTSPTVVSWSVPPGGTNVIVTFSEYLSAESFNTFNYSIDEGGVASVQSNGFSVILTPNTPLQECGRHKLEIIDVYDLSLNPYTATIYITPEIILMEPGDQQNWQINQSGVFPGNDWFTRDYDDSGWNFGEQLLDGTAAMRATLPNGVPVRTQLVLTNETYPTNVIPSYYFRTRFHLPTGPASVTRLRLRTLVDDGVAIYLNEQDVFRLRNPVDTYHEDYVPTSVGDATYEGPFDLPISALVEGENLLAVQVKNSSATSSDITVGLELIATLSACGPGLRISYDGTQATLTWSDGTYGLERAAAAGGAWSRVTGATSPHTTTTPGFYRLVKP